ncbi:hypothetical protein K1719_033229 [Acacia pycnantha]|nr:hypothetical protein K1719_033229 [Acacia pycnantha]
MDSLYLCSNWRPFHQQRKCRSDALPSDACFPKLQNDPTKLELIPSELITCVATLIMIQTCTERQYPPG